MSVHVKAADCKDDFQLQYFSSFGAIYSCHEKEVVKKIHSRWSLTINSRNKDTNFITDPKSTCFVKLGVLSKKDFKVILSNGIATHLITGIPL